MHNSLQQLWSVHGLLTDGGPRPEQDKITLPATQTEAWCGRKAAFAEQFYCPPLATLGPWHNGLFWITMRPYQTFVLF